MNLRATAPIAACLLCSALELPQAGTMDRAKHGMVVSDSAIASKVGAEILAKGGNAVDAAVATGFALAVTFPAAGNIGGGGFMLVRLKSGETVFIDYRETAPAGATRDMYLDQDKNVIKDLSLIGHKAVGVPGTVAGFYAAHKRFGKLPWKDLIEPAIKLAEDGFEIGYGLASSFRSEQRILKSSPESWRHWCREGKFYEWGDTLRQPDLAKTLTRIAEKGRDGFYEGETADFLVADMQKSGGLIDANDLARFQPEIREALKGTYRGYEIVTAPPPSSGGVALIEMLNVLEGADLRSLGAGSSSTYHWLIEAMLRAFADRSEYLGDPGFVKVPVQDLTSKAYAATLRVGIKPDKATAAKDIHPGIGTVPEGENTTHFSVVDTEGNAVSNTYTLNGSFGSGVTVPGAGFLLNNEMDDFASKPGVPNSYGLFQGEANCVAAGKRPLSSMTPTMVLKDGQLYLVLGSPGGPTIINTVMETILNVLDFGMTAQQAVNAPRLHHQWLPDEIRFEQGALNADTKLILEKMGHKFAVRPGSIGSCQAIFIDPTTGHRIAGLDRRVSSSGAAGY